MTDNKQYPPLPDFDEVEQHIYGACRRYITQDMLEPIHNLIRDAIDADRAMRAQAAPVAQGDARVQGLIAAADYIDGPASGYAAEHSYTEPSPMAKVAAALRQKAEQEDAAYQARRLDA